MPARLVEEESLGSKIGSVRGGLVLDSCGGFSEFWKMAAGSHEMAVITNRIWSWSG
jgi:hypothetical protein